MTTTLHDTMLLNLYAERNYCIAAISNKQAQLEKIDAEIAALQLQVNDAKLRKDIGLLV